MTDELHYLVIAGTNERLCIDVARKTPKIYDSWTLAEDDRLSFGGLEYSPISVNAYGMKYGAIQ